MKNDSIPAAFLAFTCARDADLLPLWAEAIQRAAPGAPMFAAVDAADADMQLPADVRRLVTSFPRNGTLNGQDAVLGILSTINEVAHATSLPVVKIDSDTLLAGAQWLEYLTSHDLDAVFFEGGYTTTATGICYAIAPRMAEALVKLNRRWPWLPSDRCPEDRTICHLATLAAAGSATLRAALLPWDSARYVLAFRADQFHRPLPLYIPAAAVHCGQIEYLNETDPDEPRSSRVLSAMSHTLAVWSSSPQITPRH